MSLAPTPRALATSSEWLNYDTRSPENTFGGADLDLLKDLDIQSAGMWDRLANCQGGSLERAKIAYLELSLRCKTDTRLKDDLTGFHRQMRNMVESTLVWNYVAGSPDLYRSKLSLIPGFNPLFRQVLVELLAQYGIFFKLDYKVETHSVRNIGRKTGHAFKWIGNGIAQVTLALTDTVNPVSGYHNIVDGNNAYFLNKFRDKYDMPTQPQSIVPSASFRLSEAEIEARVQVIEKILLLILRSSMNQDTPLGFLPFADNQILDEMFYSVLHWVSPTGTTLKGTPSWLLGEILAKRPTSLDTKEVKARNTDGIESSRKIIRAFLGKS